MDRLTPAQRSSLMSNVRGKDTRAERTVRSLLHRMGYRFRLHKKELPGTPDIVLPKYKAVIFVHGCFWHRHPNCSKTTTPKSHTEFWQTKFAQNVERDARVARELKSSGWKVLIVWECELKATDALAERLLRELPQPLPGEMKAHCDS